MLILIHFSHFHYVRLDGAVFSPPVPNISRVVDNDQTEYISGEQASACLHVVAVVCAFVCVPVYECAVTASSRPS